MRSRKNAFLAERLAALSEDERSLVRAAAPILERLAEDAGERR
jgi:DNA-binding IclR family transcriptional regulator